MTRRASERVRPPVARASVIPAGARMSPGLLVTLPQPGWFTRAQLRALPRRMKDRRDILAMRLAYAVSGEHASNSVSGKDQFWS